MPKKKKLRATVVCTRQGKVLLVSKDETRWMLPGGRPEKGESTSEAAERELHEETGIRAKKLGLVFQFVGATTVHDVYIATIGKDARARPRNEIAYCRWATVEDIISLTASLTTKLIAQGVLGMPHSRP